MPAHYFIRKAHEGDAEEILKLIKELATFEKATNEVTINLSIFKEHGWGKHPHFDAWVAMQDGIITGMALCYVRYSTWKGPMLYLEDLYIKPEARNTGIGKGLFETCLNFAKTQNHAGMCWQVLDWNEPAITFYKKFNSTLDAEWINGKIMF